MAVNEQDVLLLNALARYSVLTRDQLQCLRFPKHSGGRPMHNQLL